MARVNPNRRAEIGREKRKRTNQKIVDAALRVIAAKGLDNFSIDDVVTEAGISRGSFYNYYPDREGLVSDMADRMQDLLRQDGGFVFDPARSMRDNLIGYLRAIAGFLRRAHQKPDWGWLILEVFAAQHMERPFLGSYDPNIFFDLVEELGKSGFIAYRTTEAVYDTYIGALYFTLARIIRVPDGGVEDVLENHFFHMLLAFGMTRDEAEALAKEVLVERGGLVRQVS